MRVKRTRSRRLRSCFQCWRRLAVSRPLGADAAAGRAQRRPATATPAPPQEPAPPPSVTIIGAQEAHGVLGRDVRSAANEDMGRIVDVIVDRSGTVRAAVIDFGGFLGVGSRKSSSTGTRCISAALPTRATASRSN